MSSILKYFGIFNHIKYKVTPKIACQIYYAFIYSRIQYGIEVYRSCSETHINRLQVIQNKLLKLILKLDRLTSTNIHHKEINVLEVTHIGESGVLGFVNKVLCGQCPAIFLSYYEIKRHADVRTKGQLVTPQTRSITYLHTNFLNITTSYKWQWCEFSKSLAIVLSKWKDVCCGIELTKICWNIDFLNHLMIILWSITYLHTNFLNITTLYKWQWCEFSKSIPFITAAYFLVYFFNILSQIKDFILFVSLCTFIVNCVSLYQVSPAQIWVASWIYELFRPPGPRLNIRKYVFP